MVGLLPINLASWEWLSISLARTGGYIEESWKGDPKWIQDRKEAVKQLWLQDYKGKAITITTTPTSKPAAKRQKNGFNSYRNRPRQPPEDSVIADEYEKYLSQPLIEVYEGFDLLSWWLDPLREAEFPSLVRMAWDILSVPGMAASNERVFSRSRDTVTYKRGHLIAETIEMTECIRNWNASGLIKPVSTHHQSTKDILTIQELYTKGDLRGSSGQQALEEGGGQGE